MEKYIHLLLLWCWSLTTTLEIDFWSKACLGRCLAMFGVGGTVRSSRCGICNVRFWGWLALLAAGQIRKLSLTCPWEGEVDRKSATHIQIWPTLRGLFFSGTRFGGIGLRTSSSSGRLCGHSFWQLRPQVPGLAQKTALTRGEHWCLRSMAGSFTSLIELDLISRVKVETLKS